MDCIIIFPGIGSNFLKNGIHSLPEKQKLLEKTYFEDLEILSDSALSASEESE